VAPEHRNRGYARQLMEFAEQHVGDDAGGLRLWCDRSMIGFYSEKIGGWEVDHDIERRTDNNDTVVMRKIDIGTWSFLNDEVLG
jgi:GNAT superfamily N-acetyltransferase